MAQGGGLGGKHSCFKSAAFTNRLCLKSAIEKRSRSWSGGKVVVALAVPVPMVVVLQILLVLSALISSCSSSSSRSSRSSSSSSSSKSSSNGGRRGSGDSTSRKPVVSYYSNTTKFG